MYIVKLGDLYVASDGSLVAEKSEAARFDTSDAADSAVVVKPRRVKLRQRG